MKRPAQFQTVLVALTSSIFVDAHCPTPPSSPLDFGSCSDPGIVYGFNIDNSQRYGYAPRNSTFFPHGWSPDIATIESFICNRLESPCNAPPETVRTCREAFNLYSGLTGDNAIRAWNVELGLTAHNEDDKDNDNDDDDGSCYDDQPYDADYITTTTTTIYVAASPTYQTSTAIDLTTTTETLTTITTSTHLETYTTTTDAPSRRPSTLTLTITLPTSTTSDRNPASVDTSLVSIETTFTTRSTDVTSSVAAQATGSTAGSDSSSSNNNNNNNNNNGGDGGGSPFDPESGAPSVQRDFMSTSVLALLGMTLLVMAAYS